MTLVELVIVAGIGSACAALSFCAGYFLGRADGYKKAYAAFEDGSDG